MKLIVQKPNRIADSVRKILPLLVGLAYLAACIWFAVWLFGSKWLGVPLGFFLCKAILVLCMNAYDKLVIPLLRRRERMFRRSAKKCERYGDPGCDR